MDLLIKGGKIIKADSEMIGDIAVKNGKIVEIAKEIVPTEDAKIVDASNLYVLPGAIDVHTHLALEAGGTISADDYQAGTRAAACGGVTTIFDYPTQPKGGSIVETIEKRNKMCQPVACVDYAFHCAITDLKGDMLFDEFEEAISKGITSFKCYMVYKQSGLRVYDDDLKKILIKAKEYGVIVTVHAENEEKIEENIEKFRKEGKMNSPWYHYLSRPEEVESMADEHLIALAKEVDSPVYIVHLANKKGLEAAVIAKKKGQQVYIETCPQYLAFTNEVYKQENGRKFVCSPPIKGKDSQDALWEAIKKDEIDTIATDHCPFMSYEKDWGKDDFTKIPNGCAGIENSYAFMLNAANEGKITFQQVVKLCAQNPAKIFGCTEKGSLEVGKDADIVLYNPSYDFKVSIDNMHSDYDHTIWEGYQLHGYPIATYLRGKLIYENGKYVGTPGEGKYILRKI